MHPTALAVKLDATLAIWKLPDDWAAMAPFYIEALADVPADLVDIALKHVRLNCKWFPKPAELRAPIERLLAERQRVAADRAHRDAEHAQQLRERAEWLGDPVDPAINTESALPRRQRDVQRERSRRASWSPTRPASRRR
jgi:hypothetical protein